MTDKEKIIIDGVDVSGCKEYIWALSHVCNLVNGRTDKFECNYYPNCYFKQLARKTQECEELKKKLRELELKNTTLQNRYQQLDGATIELNRYRKALEEIEGIAKNFGSYAAWQEQRINKILDIVNKAKEQ